LKLNKELNISVHEGVYTPSDDTFLLLEMMTVDGDEKVLEIGCGSGIISLHCSVYGCDVLSVDKDQKAIENTITNAKQNDIDITVRKSNLFSNVTENDWNIIIFNPPYLPEDDLLKEDNRWDGGKRGDEVVVEFLQEAEDYMRGDGKLYLCYSSLSPTDLIKEVMGKKYEIKKEERKEFFFETLYGVELNKKNG